MSEERKETSTSTATINNDDMPSFTPPTLNDVLQIRKEVAERQINAEANASLEPVRAVAVVEDDTDADDADADQLSVDADESEELFQFPIKEGYSGEELKQMAEVLGCKSPYAMMEKYDTLANGDSILGIEANKVLKVSHIQSVQSGVCKDYIDAAYSALAAGMVSLGDLKIDLSLYEVGSISPFDELFTNDKKLNERLEDETKKWALKVTSLIKKALEGKSVGKGGSSGGPRRSSRDTKSVTYQGVEIEGKSWRRQYMNLANYLMGVHGEWCLDAFDEKNKKPGIIKSQDYNLLSEADQHYYGKLNNHRYLYANQSTETIETKMVEMVKVAGGNEGDLRII